MAKYIDAEKLEKDGWSASRTYRQDEKIMVYEVKKMTDLPTVDVQEVKHGNWVGIDDDPCETFECDRCGFVLDDWTQGIFYNFCPNCGADMREESDNG